MHTLLSSGVHNFAQSWKLPSGKGTLCALPCSEHPLQPLQASLGTAHSSASVRRGEKIDWKNHAQSYPAITLEQLELKGLTDSPA